MSIGLNITGCSDGKGGNDNENVNKNKSYSEVALEVLEERYGEPFELRQIGGTFGAYRRNTRKLICNPVSNPNTYCFVEVESDKTEVHDDYSDRIMEERFAVMLEEEAKKIFEDEINIKLKFNSFYDGYQYLDMDLLEFYKNNVYPQYSIDIFINSNGNIDKNAEAQKMLSFSNMVLESGLNENSGIWFWYCKEDTYDEVNESYYLSYLSGEMYEYYSDENRTYNNSYIRIKDRKLEQDINGAIDNFE